ncbi:MAG: hypothetical protein ACRCT2_08930, partial [Plesiomonas shigelloides]
MFTITLSGDLTSSTHETNDPHDVTVTTAFPTFNPVPENVPLSGTNLASDLDAGWCLPFQAKGQMPLGPSLARGRSSALVTVLRQSAIQSRTLTTVTASSLDEKQLTFEFSRELMLSNYAHKIPVRRIAFWASWRCALATDPPITTITVPPSRFDHPYLFAPGRFNPELTPHLRQAWQRKPNTPQFQELVNWFENECSLIDMEDDSASLPCHIQPNFFNTSVVQALASVSFQSGYKIRKEAEPPGILTPWSFIRSLEDFRSQSAPRIPADGLQAHHISDLIDNVVFLISLLTQDTDDSPCLGTGHSAFSRFSPLAGHLLLLGSYFQRKAFITHWNKMLSPASRFTYTKAALIELFNLYETWHRPVEASQDVFRPAACGSSTDLILITPAIDASGRRHLPFFQQWRSQISVFTID